MNKDTLLSTWIRYQRWHLLRIIVCILKYLTCSSDKSQYVKKKKLSLLDKKYNFDVK